MKIKDTRAESFTKQIRCDRCGCLSEIGEVEFSEIASIDLKAGYGSIFGDGNDVQIDLCQYCLKLTLGRWLRIAPPQQHSSAIERFVSRFQPGLHGDSFPAVADIVRPEQPPVQEKQPIDGRDRVQELQVGILAEERTGPDEFSVRPPSGGTFGFEAACGEAAGVLAALEDRRDQGHCNISDRAEYSVITNLCRSIREQLDVVSEYNAVLSRQLARTRARLAASPESAAIEQLAAQVFESEAEAWVWLNTPHLRFSGKTPLQIVETGGGSERVREILVALKHGGVV
jgi:hypothetical protein